MKKSNKVILNLDIFIAIDKNNVIGFEEVVKAVKICAYCKYKYLRDDSIPVCASSFFNKPCDKWEFYSKHI